MDDKKDSVLTGKLRKGEDEFFAREEKHRRALDAIRRERDELIKQRDLHRGKCPSCGGDLEKSIYNAVSVKRCAECRGVWVEADQLEELAGKESHFVHDVLIWLGGRDR